MFRKYLAALFSFVIISSWACDSTQIRLDSTVSGPGPLNGFEINMQCLDSSLVLYFQDALKISTIHAKGENFIIIVPNKDTILANEIIPDTNNLGTDSTKQLYIQFKRPLIANGKYQLVIKPDNQNIPIENVCGAQWNSDSIPLVVEGCFIAQIEITSISRIHTDSLKVKWEIDSTSFPNYLFDAYHIYRKTPIDGSFSKVHSLHSIYLQDYTDGNLPMGTVGFTEYYISLELNALEVAFTDTMGYYLVLGHEEEKLTARWISNKHLWAVDVSEKSELTILDLNGRLLFSQKIKKGFNEILMDALPSGVYFAYLNNRFFKKLIKF